MTELGNYNYNYNNTQTYDMDSPYVVIASIGSRQQENGSGVYIGSNIVITCNHVLKFDKNYVNGQSAIVISRSVSKDLAILKTSIRVKNYLNLSTKSLKQGQNISIISNPLGLNYTMSTGIISNINRFVDGQRLPSFQFTAPVSKGSSGAAVVDEEGEIVGLAKSTINEGQNLNFGIPADQIQEELDNIN
jgi:S1-C subfamily serine protease